MEKLFLLDILIPLGKGSHWDNNELRYCLRSIEKHLSGYGKIFIVGECPKWLTGIIHIPFDDEPGYGNRDANIFRKILAGINDDRMSDEFLFFNDDHFLLNSFESTIFPYFFNGTISGKIRELPANVPYGNVLDNTLRHLELAQHTSLFFDIHCPISYSKKQFNSYFPAQWPRYGFAIKSMYCNQHKVNCIEYPDLKFRQKMSRADIYDQMEDRIFFSIGDRCLHGDMKTVLEELYSSKSKYEI